MSTFAYAHPPIHDDLSTSSSHADTDSLHSRSPPAHHPDLDEDTHPLRPRPHNPVAPRSQGPLIPTIPDLRFEQSYMRSIRPHLHLSPRADVEVQGLRRDVAPVVDAARKIESVEWAQVVWVTTRDQVISPFLQGALWGVASHFIRPFVSLVGAQLRARLPTPAPGGTREQGWWRAWAKGLGVGAAGREINPW